MNMQRSLSGLVAACFAMLIANEAAATANIGGVISLVGDSGGCNYSQLVPLNTPQDTFALSGTTGCNGTMSTVNMHGEAATGSIGLYALSSGNGLGSSQVAAQVSLVDYWLLTAPSGTAQGFISIPVSIKLDGSISAGALSGFDRFLNYNLTISDHYSALNPGGSFSALGKITASGNFSQTFSGSVNFYNYASSALPMRADVGLSFDIPGLNEGVLDFYNTGSISMILPPGFSATTSSGAPLVFAPVPEPETYAMMFAGLGMLGWRMRR